MRSVKIKNMKVKVFELATVDMTLYKFVLPLMKELRQNGFDVICGAGEHGYLDKIADEGFTIYTIPFQRSLNPLAIIRSFIYLIQIFRNEKVDILHTHTPIASFVGRFAAALSGVKVKIYTAHGFIFEPKLYEFIEKFMARTLTSYIFTVSSEDYAYALENRFISPYSIMNINSVGVDTKHFDPARIDKLDTIALKESLKINEEPVIGYVGRIVRSKGVLDLIQAFIELRKTINCKLLLVGPWDLDERSDDAVMDEIRVLLQRHQLEQEILFIGQREDIAELLSVIDIFVLPSYREGMPVSLLEAMAMEKVVIGTNIRGVREEITEDCGFLYKPKDIDGLKEQLLFCLSNMDNVRDLGKAARKRVMSLFSLEQVLNKQIQVFNSYKNVLLEQR